MSMRLAVLGAGAIGGSIGGYLARAKHDVTLIDLWPANVERIRTKGLTVTSLEEEFTVQPSAVNLGEVSAIGRLFDAVILAVKSYDTDWSAKFIEPHLAPGGFIVSAQNSINEEAIATVVGWPRVVGCVVTISAEMTGPGHVQRTTAFSRPATVLGEPSGMMTRRLEEMAKVLSDFGPARTTTNLWGERWAKLGTNCMNNATAGLTGLSSAGLRENPQARHLAIRIASELVRVASAFGVSVEPIGGIPADMFVEAVDDAAKRREVEDEILEAGKTIGSGRPSLAQDVIKGRRTEVEYLNGYVVRKGREVGVPTPVNEAVVEITKRVEAGDLEPSESNLNYIT
jgi:2-dehydropantoate 2-reductase